MLPCGPGGCGGKLRPDGILDSCSARFSENPSGRFGIPAGSGPGPFEPWSCSAAPPRASSAARRASKSARKKASKKKAPRSGDPRRAAELASGGGQQGQDPKAANGPGQLPAGLPNLGGGLGDLPEGLSENLAEQLSKMPSGLNFPPQGPQGNIPAAFRGGGKRKKK